jgi:CyaY protein
MQAIISSGMVRTFNGNQDRSKRIMTETEFMAVSQKVIDGIEAAFDTADIDVDLERKGDGILEIEFESGSKIVINSQTPMRQIWVAARSGGFHFAQHGTEWTDTRSGERLQTLLARVTAEQSGQAVSFE